MSTATAETPDIPTIEWDLIDRLHKSLRLADLKPGQMADYLGLHRNTVGGWLHGKARMNKATLIAWAAKCSETSPIPITFDWLTESYPRSFFDTLSSPIDQGTLLDGAGQPLEFDYPRLAPVVDLASRRAS